VLTLSKRLDDKGEMDEGDKDAVQFFEAGEDAPEAFEAAEEPLNFISLLV
jgi:hypothetical protein